MQSVLSFMVVDDDDVFRKRLVRAIRDRGFTAYEAAHAEDALETASEYRPQRAILDLRMPGNSGLVLLEQLRTHSPEMEIVMLTGYGSIATALDAVRLGARHYLTKPADVDQILGAFEGPVPQPERSGIAVPPLEQVEWEHINRVVTDCGGNISKAAKLLGLHRRSLQRKLARVPRV